ncbi:hypothetical protein [Parasitella parasitica]|uniref:Ndc10 domain-containing protein n=1 Tax=Parasitella parasitica TaxID=35722 RepID=A0A0B7MVY4_9FUNG|nr:hypothetical protein [Parasitella parasitica]
MININRDAHCITRSPHFLIASTVVATQQAVAVVFRLQTGITLEHGEMKFAFTVRHTRASVVARLGLEVVQENGSSAPEDPLETQASRQVLTGYDHALREFIILFFRCRRVILQDAAVMRTMNRSSLSLYNPVFRSPEFAAFRHDVAAALDNTEHTMLQEFEDLVPNIVGSQKDVAASISQVHNDMVRLKESVRSSLKNHAQSINTSVDQHFALMQTLITKQRQIFQQQWSQQSSDLQQLIGILLDVSAQLLGMQDPSIFSSLVVPGPLDDSPLFLSFSRFAYAFILLTFVFSLSHVPGHSSSNPPFVYSTPVSVRPASSLPGNEITPSAARRNKKISSAAE